MQPIRTENILRVSETLKMAGLRFIFIGGGIVGFLVNDPASPPVRTTIDVDIVLDIATDPGQEKLESLLREVGFKHDISSGAPICRWVLDDIKVDILSIKDKFSGMNLKWLREAVSDPISIDLNGKQILISSAPCFIAMKLEAFNDRGGEDYWGSRDMEDFISVVDGRLTLLDEIYGADNKVKEYIVNTTQSLLGKKDFILCISGHLPPDPVSQSRKEMVVTKLEKIANMPIAATM